MFTRYAIYYVPEPGSPLAQFGAAWLGWEVSQPGPRDHPDVPGLPLPVEQITQTPRKYGFHATLKPPFRLAEGQSLEALQAHTKAFCASTAAARADGLALTTLGSFLALTPTGDQSAVNSLAGRIVEAFEPFRAPLTQADLARRRKHPLTDRQDALLTRWGYPFVMEEFHFHMTLSGRLDTAASAAVAQALDPHIAPLCPAPFLLDGLGLMGEAEDGQFHLIDYHALTG